MREHRFGSRAEAAANHPVDVAHRIDDCRDARKRTQSKSDAVIRAAPRFTCTASNLRLYKFRLIIIRLGSGKRSGFRTRNRIASVGSLVGQLKLESFMMVKVHRFIPVLAFCASITVAACATAANKTEAVGNDTGGAAASVGDSVVAVIEWPFHAIADVL